MQNNYIKLASFILKSNNYYKPLKYFKYNYGNYLNNRHRLISFYANKNRNLIVSRHFSTSEKRQSLSYVLSVLVVFMKPISRFLNFIIQSATSLYYNDIKRKLSTPFVWSHLKRNKNRYLISISTFSIGLGLFYYTHLQVAPITNRKRFLLFLPFQIEQIDDMRHKKIKEQYGSKIVTTQTRDVTRIKNVINRIVKANSDIELIKNTDWNLMLVDDPDVNNSTVFPCGVIVIFTGLLKNVRTDDELAAVLGHEMSHALLQHFAERISRTNLIDLFKFCLTLTVKTVFPSKYVEKSLEFFSNEILEVGAELPEVRFLELEADEVGMYLAARACYDVRQFPELLKRHIDEKPEIVSTHYSVAHRVSDLEKRLPQVLKIREDCKCHKLPNLEEYASKHKK